jgi:HlyD family secretion protein
MRNILRIVVVALVLAAGVWAYRANVGSGSPAMDMKMRVTSGNTPFPVILASVARGTVAGAVTYTGSVAPFNEEDIYPRVMGRIVEMSVYPGDRVKKGQILARLDDVELGSRVREAEAMLATSQANQLQMEADLLAARQGVVQMERELAMAQADAEYQQSVAARDELLYTKGAVSRQDADSSRAMGTGAKAKVEAAQAKVEQSRAMETSAQKKLEAAATMIALGQAQLRTAQVVRGYVDIVAPNDGQVVKRMVSPGVLVEPGMAILKVTQVDKVRLQANVGERDLGSIKVGAPVTVTTSGSGGAPIVASVSSVFPYVDPGGRTAVVEAVIVNADSRLVPGQYVQMQLTTGVHEGALSVPRGAVIRLGSKATVWVRKGEDRVAPVEVTTGLENEDQVEILSGLAGDERVVVQGQEGLYADARIRETTAAPTAGTAAGRAAGSVGGTAVGTGGGSSAGTAGVTGSGTGTRAGGGTAAGKSHAGMAGMEEAPATTPDKLQIVLTSKTVTLSGGNATLRIAVKDTAGNPVSKAAVEVSAAMGGMEAPKKTAQAAKDAGVYEATLNLGMAGTWTVNVTVARPQGGTTAAEFELEAK